MARCYEYDGLPEEEQVGAGLESEGGEALCKMKRRESLLCMLHAYGIACCRSGGRCAGKRLGPSYGPQSGTATTWDLPLAELQISDAPDPSDLRAQYYEGIFDNEFRKKVDRQVATKLWWGEVDVVPMSWCGCFIQYPFARPITLTLVPCMGPSLCQLLLLH